MKLEFDNEYFMKKAIEEADIALSKGEIPIGAVIVIENQIIARAHNLTETLNDVTAHAEILAITAAANYLGGKYLDGCSIYVTLEPCQMCAGALYWSRISNLYYAAKDSIILSLASADTQLCQASLLLRYHIAVFRYASSLVAASSFISP